MKPAAKQGAESVSFRRRGGSQVCNWGVQPAVQPAVQLGFAGQGHRGWVQEGTRLGHVQGRWHRTPAQPRGSGPPASGLRDGGGNSRRPLLAASPGDGCYQQPRLQRWPSGSRPRGHSFPLRPQSWGFRGDFHQLQTRRRHQSWGRAAGRSAESTSPAAQGQGSREPPPLPGNF